jgi:hypothetical protein
VSMFKSVEEPHFVQKNRLVTIGRGVTSLSKNLHHGQKVFSTGMHPLKNAMIVGFTSSNAVYLREIITNAEGQESLAGATHSTEPKFVHPQNRLP